MRKRHTFSTPVTIGLFVSIALLTVGFGVAGCGGSDNGTTTTGTTTNTGTTTPSQGLQIENSFASTRSFVAVQITNLGSGSSQNFSGMNVAPGQRSQVFNLSPGLYSYMVQIDYGAGGLLWSNSLTATVNSGQVTLSTVLVN